MTRQEALSLLKDAADLEYKEFNDRITNCDTAPSIGVRVPRVREIAAQVVKQGWEEYLAELESVCAERREHADGAGQAVIPAGWQGQATISADQQGQAVIPAGRQGQAEETVPSAPLWQEEHMLWGIVIGRAKMDQEERVRRLNLWVPGILSWADCDCSVSSFKFMKKDQPFWYDYCVSWLSSDREYAQRFAYVALMQYFINDSYIDRVLEIFRGKEHGFADQPYYVKMARAWALSVCFVKYRDRTLPVFEARTMDSWVQNKAIQKCRESYRVSAEDKELLLQLKV